MSSERYKLISEVHLFLFKANQTLLLLRANTGYEDGKYSVVAGHLDKNESVRSAIAREAYEEAGIKINIEDLKMVHVMHRKSQQDRISFFFTCNKYQGNPFNKETDKCAELKWFDLDNLPHNMVEYVKKALEYYHKNVIHSDYGF